MKLSKLYFMSLLALTIGTAILDPAYFTGSIAMWGMIFTPGPLVGAVSGSLGGVTASRNKGGSYLRLRAIPTDPATLAQQNQRARMSTVSQTWQTITDADRESWNEWARQNPVTNALGISKILSGSQAYNGINSRMLLLGQTQLINPPVVPAPPAFLTSVQTADIGTGTFELAFTAALESGNQVELWAAITNSPGIKFVRNLYKFIGFSAVDQATPFDNQSIIETILGSLVAGQKLHVQAAQVSPATSLRSPFVRSDVVVTDTP